MIARTALFGEIMSFESDLDSLFENAIDVEDMIWYDNFETLRDAIVRIYHEN